METLGSDLGSRLMPAAAGNNDKGFFEDIDINQVNIEVMRAAGCDWDTMTSIDLGMIDSHRLDELRVKAAAMLRTKHSGQIFALKDPRIVRLWTFWQPIFASLPFRVVYAIAVRDPISVARSLSKRNGFADEKTYILWLAHTVAALEATTGSSRTLVSYDALLSAPRPELERISSELELPLIESRIDSFEREFLDDELRHHRFLPQDLDLPHSLPPQVKTLFAALDSSIRNRLPLDNPALVEALARARGYLDDIEPLLRYEWQLDRQFHAAQAAADASNETLRVRTGELETLSATLASLNEAARLSEQQQLTLSNALQHAHLERDEARQALASAEREMTAMKAELDRAYQSQRDILASTSWAVTSPLRALGRILKRR
jgi:hypothetical protein